MAHPRVTANRTIVAAARQGDRAALDELWQANRRWVAAVLLAHKPATADLDDLLQEVAMTLVSRVSDLRDDASFRGWLRTVAVNVARLAGRNQRNRPMLRLAGTDAELDDPRSAQGSADEEARRLLAIASGLPEGYREPLLLRALQGMSYRQIAEMLDLPETTIETRISRARRMVREACRETNAIDARATAAPVRS